MLYWFGQGSHRDRPQIRAEEMGSATRGSSQVTQGRLDERTATVLAGERSLWQVPIIRVQKHPLGHSKRTLHLVGRAQRTWDSWSPSAEPSKCWVCHHPPGQASAALRAGSVPGDGAAAQSHSQTVGPLGGGGGPRTVTARAVTRRSALAN